MRVIVNVPGALHEAPDIAGRTTRALSGIERWSTPDTTHERSQRRHPPVHLPAEAAGGKGRGDGAAESRQDFLRFQARSLGNLMAPLCSAVPGRRGGVWAWRLLPFGLLPDTPEEHQRRADMWQCAISRLLLQDDVIVVFRHGDQPDLDVMQQRWIGLDLPAVKNCGNLGL